MRVMTTSDLRNKLGAALDAVIENDEELIVPRDGEQAVVIVSLDTWNSMTETLHVLGGRKQTRALLDSLDELDAGNYVEYVPVGENAEQPAVAA